jgi:pimeloyl-ACP methyl ester carboxylesterase
MPLVFSRGISHADVLGFSMANFIAQELVLRHRDLVDALVLYGTDCGGAENVAGDPAVLKTLVDTSGTPAAYVTRLLKIFLPASWLADPANADYAARVFEQSGKAPPPQTIGLQAQAALSWPGTCDRLQNVTQPALVIAGDADVVIPPANASIVAAHLAHAQVKIFADGGHFMMLQFPADLADAVMSFLSGEQP